MDVYFSTGYIPAWDMDKLLMILNWCGSRGIEMVFVGQSIQERPLSAISGKQMEMIAIPLVKTTETNFEKVFGRPWDVSLMVRIPAELTELVKENPAMVNLPVL